MPVLFLVNFCRRIRRNRGLGLVAVSVILVAAIMGNAITFYIFDRQVNPDITFADAVWYSIISMTTIGYGDYSAQTMGARIGTLVFIVLIGLSTFTVFFGILIDTVTDAILMGERGMGKTLARNHTIIVHFPSQKRVETLVNQVVNSPHDTVVVVSDRIDSLPFRNDSTTFIKGSSLSHDVLMRAGAAHAREAIVLATSYEDSSSDAVVASAASVLNDIRPEMHIVAECLDDSHRNLFDSVGCDAVISGLRISGNLLVQEARDPGVGRALDVMTNNLVGDTLFSAEVVDAKAVVQSYSEFVKTLLDRGINVISVVRGASAHTRLADIHPEPGDRVVYLYDRRLTWHELQAAGTQSA